MLVRTTIRAFNEEGYHRDILIQDQIQVRMNDARMENYSGIDGCGMSFDPAKFPEAVKFVVIIETFQQ